MSLGWRGCRSSVFTFSSDLARIDHGIRPASCRFPSPFPQAHSTASVTSLQTSPASLFLLRVVVVSALLHMHAGPVLPASLQQTAAGRSVSLRRSGGIRRSRHVGFAAVAGSPAAVVLRARRFLVGRDATPRDYGNTSHLGVYLDSAGRAGVPGAQQAPQGRAPQSQDAKPRRAEGWLRPSGAKAALVIGARGRDYSAGLGDCRGGAGDRRCSRGGWVATSPFGTNCGEAKG